MVDRGNEMLQVAVCVDDTDDLTKRTSTGAVCGAIAQVMMTEFGARIEFGITRHQLLLDPSVPYTSHNSSMCFTAHLLASDGVGKTVQLLVGKAVEQLAALCAESADPGLCICPVPADGEDPDWPAHLRALEEFGRSAQERVLTKDDAYALARTVPGLSLSEHGGTGDGVIGALAGVGLRLSGNDGRFRGAWDLTPALAASHEMHAPNWEGTIAVGNVRAWLASRGLTAAILDEFYRPVPDNDAKATMHAGLPTIIAGKDAAGIWRTFEKSDLDRMGERDEDSSAGNGRSRENSGSGDGADSGDGSGDGSGRGGGSGRNGGSGRGSGGGRGNGAGNGSGAGSGGSGHGSGSGRNGGSGRGSGAGNGGSRIPQNGSGEPAIARKTVKRATCPDYVEDADDEEHTSDPTLHLCGSCLYRRLTNGGFSCMKGNA